MKKLLILIVVVSFFGFRPVDNVVNIDQAVKTGLVTCAIKVNTESTHYISPISLTVMNTKSTPVSVRIPNGMQFFPEDSIYQNLITTQEELLVLNPGKPVTVPVFSMCTEHTDRAPGSETKYKIGKQANEKITLITKYIESQKLHDPLGQSAVWAMTCGSPLEDISGFDTTAARKLVTLVAKTLGKNCPPPPAKEDTRRNYYATNYSSSMHGTFNYDFFKTSNVTIAMFNKDNIVVRELYRNPAEPPGKHKLEYKFDSTQYTEDFYVFKLIADGEVILSCKLNNRDDLRRN